jgi:hypothetical protein
MSRVLEVRDEQVTRQARRATERRRRGALLADEEAARQTRKRRDWVANGQVLVPWGA